MIQYCLLAALPYPKAENASLVESEKAAFNLLRRSLENLPAAIEILVLICPQLIKLYAAPVLHLLVCNRHTVQTVTPHCVSGPLYHPISRSVVPAARDHRWSEQRLSISCLCCCRRTAWCTRRKSS